MKNARIFVQMDLSIVSVYLWVLIRYKLFQYSRLNLNILDVEIEPPGLSDSLYME